MLERAERVTWRDVLRRWWCAAHGHNHLLRFEPGRIFLRCEACGEETPGWVLVDWMG